MAASPHSVLVHFARPLATVALALAFLAPTAVVADSPGRGRSYSVDSPNRRFTMRMSSRTGIDVFENVAHKPTKTRWGLWAAAYAPSAFLANDGDHWAAWGWWPNGHEVSKFDAAIFFYKRKKLVAQYSTADLVSNPKALLRSVSHYQWRVPQLGGPAGRGRFIDVVTRESVVYRFEVSTGSCVSTRWAPPRSAEERRGGALLGPTRLDPGKGRPPRCPRKGTFERRRRR